MMLLVEESLFWLSLYITFGELNKTEILFWFPKYIFLILILLFYKTR